MGSSYEIISQLIGNPKHTQGLLGGETKPSVEIHFTLRQDSKTQPDPRRRPEPEDPPQRDVDEEEEDTEEMLVPSEGEDVNRQQVE